MDVASFDMFVEGLDHPEGVSWGPDGMLYAGGEAGQVYRIDLDTAAVHEVGTTNGFNLGLCLDAEANIYVCDAGTRVVHRMTGAGDVSAYATGPADGAFVNPNYPVFDDDGNLYVTDSGRWRRGDGAVYVVRPGGAVERVGTGLTEFPNGAALDPTGSLLYVALSTLPGVARLPVLGGVATGDAEVVVELPGTVPDGLAFDVEGNLYVSCYAPDVIYRWTPDGALDTLVADWEHVTLASPTNVTFAGRDRMTLVTANLGRWHLSKATMPIAGLPHRYPTLGS